MDSTLDTFLKNVGAWKKYVGIALQKKFQLITVAYLHHHGLFGCHDCQQKPLHAVHQRDPKQGKIKRSLVMLF